MELDEEALLVQRAQADPVAFVALYDRYVARIYAYVQRQTQDEPTTQDIVATTFTKALQHLPNYRWRGVSFGAWLYKIARNEIRRHYNRRKWTIPLLDRHASEANVEQMVHDRHQVHRVRAAMRQLPARDQEVLQLHYDEQLTHAEIGQVLGCSAGNVAVRLHRALRRLRQQVTEDGTEVVTDVS
jgi:RNA polymerase sigma-70 factor (ECF subfamily)